jgi:hypothetical protein
MWIFTNFGFVSAVNHRTKKDTLLVRAREPGVLEALGERHGVNVSVKKTPSADYLYRAEISKRVFAKMISEEIEAIDYPNFKDSFHAAKEENTATSHSALMSVWNVMYGLQRALAVNRRRGYFWR